MHELAPLLVGDAEHGGFVDVGVVFERALDLGRIDVHPAGDDHVLLAVADVEETLVVAVGDVADGLEAVAVVFEELVVLLVVVVEDVGGAHVQLAGRLGTGALHDVAGVVVETDLDERRFLAARSGLPHLVLGSHDRVDTELGRSVDLEQRLGREVGDEGLLEREAPGRRVGDHHPHRRAVVLGLHLVGQIADHPDGGGRCEGRRAAVGLEQAQPVLGVELALEHHRLTHPQRGRQESAGTGVIQRAGGEVDVVELVADELQHRRSLLGVACGGAERALRFAGGARGVDHRAGGRCARIVVDRARVGGLDERIDRDHAAGRLAVEHEHVSDLGNLVADPGEQGRVVGVDVHDTGVAVVDDVGGLLVGEAVVERHGGRPDLAGGVDHLDDADRVLTTPDDLLATLRSVVEEDVGEPVGTVLQLGVGQDPDIAVAAVVDHGGLVGLVRSVSGQQVGHRIWLSNPLPWERVGATPTPDRRDDTMAYVPDRPTPLERITAYFEACGTGSPADIAAHFTPAAVVYDTNIRPMVGATDIGESWVKVRDRWHGARWTVDSIVADGGTAAIEWTMTGTDPESGRTFAFHGSEHYRFEGDDHLIAEIRQYWTFDPERLDTGLRGYPPHAD